MEWQVTLTVDHNKRMSFGVRLKSDGGSNGDQVLWEGPAPSRQAAWDSARRLNACLPPELPSAFQSLDTLAKPLLLPVSERFKRQRNPNPSREEALIQILKAVAASPIGMSCADVGQRFEMNHQAAAARIRVLVSRGCLEPAGDRPGMFVAVSGVLGTAPLEPLPEPLPEPKSRMRKSGSSHRGQNKGRDRRENEVKITELIRDTIIAFVRSQAEFGATAYEVRVHVLSTLKGANQGSVQSRFAELKMLGHLVPHPDRLRRSRGDNKSFQEVLVYTPEAVLIMWATNYRDFAEREPRFKRILDAIDDLRRDGLKSA